MALSGAAAPVARQLTWLLAALAAATYVLAMAPLRTAWFTDDDWHFLALLRHVDAATDAFSEHFMGSYGYRPVAMVLFAITALVFGADALPQYLLNVALHAAVALLLWRLAIAFAAPNRVAMILAAALLLGPVTQATPLWISNRFDLLATALCLLALLCTHRWLQGVSGGLADAVGAVLAMLFALGSKETALAMVPPLLLLLIAYPAPNRRCSARIVLASLLLGIAAMYWLARSHALGAAAPSWSIAELVAGIRQWCWAGVSLLTHPANFIGTGLVAASFPLFWADSKRMIEAQRGARPPGADPQLVIRGALLTLVAGIVVLQGPVAAMALGITTNTAGGGEADLPLVSRRFYYFVMAGVLLLPATFRWPVAQPWGSPGRLALLLASAGLGIWAFAARQQSEYWAQATNNALHAYQLLQPEVGERLTAAAAQSQQHAAPTACVVDLTGTAGPDHRAMPTYGLPLDLIVKAHLPKGDARVDCVLITQPPQAMALTRVYPCSATAFPGWRSVHPAMAPLARSGTCTFFAQVVAQP